MQGGGDEASGDDEDGEILAEGFDLAGEVHAGALGHVEVGDEEIDVRRGLEDVRGAVWVA